MMEARKRDVSGQKSLLAGISPELRLAAWAGGSENLEKTRLSIGFVSLNDMAVLVTALEKGFFRRHGLDVTLAQEPSWANIRDKVAFGAHDAAHMLVGMPLGATLGVNSLVSPVVSAFVLQSGGNSITVSKALHERMMAADETACGSPATSAKALKKVIDADRAAGKPALTFAMTFPTSSHNFELRQWLATGGINPDEDVRMVVVPPPQMTAQLHAGRIDGYCVASPWNEFSVHLGIGHIVAIKQDIMGLAPEKVLGVSARWAEENPNTHKALIRALIEAAMWADDPDNRPEVCWLLCRGGYVEAPFEVVIRSLTGTMRVAADAPLTRNPDLQVFYRYASAFPWRNYADWTVVQMLRWGQIARPVDIRATSDQVYRPDLYRQAASELGLAAPTLDRRAMGTHDAPWLLPGDTSGIPLGPDRLLDGSVFDPADPIAFLREIKIHAMKVSLDALAALNPRLPA